MARITPLFSGSSGNSYYLGSKKAGILIDAGRSAKQIASMLQLCSIDPMAVQAILVSHEHTDHISGLRVFAARHQIPVFCSQGTKQALLNNGVANGSFPIHTLNSGLQIADMTVDCFRTSHDCAEGLGFRIKTADNRRFALATDLGFLSEEVAAGIQDCDYVVIESNHDVGMLQTGPYPYPLKRRILSDCGHLSNKACADFLPHLHKSGSKKYMLAHISSENNTPDIAYQSALCTMSMEGLVQNVDYTLAVAPKDNLQGISIVF